MPRRNLDLSVIGQDGVRFDLVFAKNGIRRVKRLVKNLEEGMSKVVGDRYVKDAVVQAIKDRFLREIGPTGKPWAPLSPATLRKDKYDGIPRKGKLLKTGTLYRSIRAAEPGDTVTRFPTGAGFRVVADARDSRGTAYAVYQHYGVPKRNVPARPFMRLPDAVPLGIQAAVRRAARKNIRQAVRKD